MFEDSLLESSAAKAALGRRAPWATLASFTIETAMIGVLLLVPLLFTEALPRLQRAQPVAPFSFSSGNVVQVQSVRIEGGGRSFSDGRITAPILVPPGISMTPDRPRADGAGENIPGSIPGSLGISANAMNVLQQVIAIAPVALPRAVETRRIPVSDGVTAGLLRYKVQPVYPALAKQARVSGAVVLQAVIGRDGAIENLRVLSGHPLLVESAMNAVRQWRYKPYLLNGQPVEVDTQITVNFTLAGS